MSRKKKKSNKTKKLDIILPIIFSILLSVVVLPLSFNAYEINFIALLVGFPTVVIIMFFSALTGKIIKSYAKNHNKKHLDLYWMLILTALLITISVIIITCNAPYYEFCINCVGDNKEISISTVILGNLFLIAFLLFPAWRSIIYEPEKGASKPKTRSKKEKEDDFEEL
jgi:hypothetical protein